LCPSPLRGRAFWSRVLQTGAVRYGVVWNGVSKKEKKQGRARALRGLADVRRFLRANETPIWFVSPTPFELLGIDHWVRRFRYVSAVDPFSGRHPHVFAPDLEPEPALESTGDVCSRLLSHPDVVARLRMRGGRVLALPLSSD